MAAAAPDPDTPVMLALEVARRYYVDGWPKNMIGERLGLSRFRVARLLDKARDNGWVRIEIDAPPDIDTELSDAVLRAYGLRHVLVVEPGPQGGLRAGVASAAARFMQEVLSPRDLVGLAWSRAVFEAVERLERLPHCPVVQLTGALPQSEAEEGSIELVRRFAAVSRAPAYFYYAPMILASDAVADALRQQPEVARTIALLPEVTFAVVALGGWAPGRSTVYDSMPPAERQRLAGAGVVGDISGVLFDDEGPLDSALSRRILCPTPDQLRAIPHVVALAYGADRADAVAAAVRTGLLQSLVVDRALAQLLVDKVDDG